MNVSGELEQYQSTNPLDRNEYARWSETSAFAGAVSFPLQESLLTKLESPFVELDKVIERFGAGDGIRTHDIQLGKLFLNQRNRPVRSQRFTGQAALFPGRVGGTETSKMEAPVAFACLKATLFTVYKLSPSEERRDGALSRFVAANKGCTGTQRLARKVLEPHHQHGIAP